MFRMNKIVCVFLILTVLAFAGTRMSGQDGSGYES